MYRTLRNIIFYVMNGYRDTPMDLGHKLNRINLACHLHLRLHMLRAPLRASLEHT